MINSGYTRNKWNKCLNINQASIKYVVLAELIIIRRSKYSTIFNYKTKKTNFSHTNLKQHHLVIKIFNKQSFQP